jgi:plastocyanin
MDTGVIEQKTCVAQSQRVGRNRVRWLLVCLALLILCACGGETPEPIRLTLVAQDIKFDVITLRGTAGQPVQLTYTNAGVIDHSLQIEGVLAEQKVRPGQTQVFEFTIPTPGTYKYVCSLPGHEQAGMVGTLIVE